MSRPCASPTPWETLVSYWAGELTGAEEAALEEHLFSCDTCAAESARLSAILEALRSMPAPLLTAEQLARMRASGREIPESRFSPGERKEVEIPPVDLFVHRLEGLDLAEATRVTFALRVEGTEMALVTHPDAPFDRDAGAVYVACSSHFAAAPPNTVAELRIERPEAPPEVVTYTILHRWAGPPG